MIFGGGGGLYRMGMDGLNCVSVLLLFWFWGGGGHVLYKFLGGSAVGCENAQT